MIDLVVATRSQHKLREIRELLGDLPGYRLIDLEQAGIPEAADEEGIEIFETFAENALAKARYFAEKANAPVLADDSGLCVTALDGAPGVRSKRFSGRQDLRGDALDQANNEHLLLLLANVPEGERTARYVCAAALVSAEGAEEVFLGACDGTILREPAGEGGFGYDPLFYLPDDGATFGQLPPARKNQLSHRARAMEQVAARLRASSRPAPPAL
jgi:XTP/dITP diphosphohydrolase